MSVIRCPSCSYSLDTAAEGPVCPSCGANATAPAAGRGPPPRYSKNKPGNGDLWESFRAVKSGDFSVNPSLVDRFSDFPPADDVPDIALPSTESWPAPPGLVDHTGALLSGGLDFFAPPPPEIGAVASAFSSLPKHCEPYSLGARLLWLLVAAIVGAVAANFIRVLASPLALGWILFWHILFISIACLVAANCTSFHHSCDYVGRDGVAKFSCRGDRTDIRSQILLFRSARELRSSLVSRYVNGAYQGTDYAFTWTDSYGRTCLQHAGTFKAKVGLPANTDAYHFGLAAELAWSIHLAAEAQEYIRLGHGFCCGLTGADFITIGDGWIEVSLKGVHQRCYREELASVNMGQGVLVITRRDAKKRFFSSSGIYNLQAKDIANLRLFLVLFQRYAAP